MWLGRLCRDSSARVSWRIHICDMTHSYVRHDSFVCVTWLIHRCDMILLHGCHDTLTCVRWLIAMCYNKGAFSHSPDTHMWGLTPRCVRHKSFTSVTCGWDMSHTHTHTHTHTHVERSCRWVTHSTCVAMTHSYMWHDSFTYVTWLIHICGTLHS